MCEELAYIEKIKQGMILLHEGCMRNELWGNCYHCPFDEYCDLILRNMIITPDDDDFINFENE